MKSIGPHVLQLEAKCLPISSQRLKLFYDISSLAFSIISLITATEVQEASPGHETSLSSLSVLVASCHICFYGLITLPACTGMRSFVVQTIFNIQVQIKTLKQVHEE